MHATGLSRRRSNPAGPPVPPSGGYPDVPVLVLTGELDTITTPAEGTLVVGQFPYARRVLVAQQLPRHRDRRHRRVRQRIVRHWIDSNGVVLPPELRACARDVPPVRALGMFPEELRAQAIPRQVARAAALTVADLPDRWWNNYSGHGVGLRGGTWRYSGSDRVRFTLDRVRLIRGLSVSGSAVWDRYGRTMTVDLTVDGVATGRLRGEWDTTSLGAVAVLTGDLDGQSVRVTIPAP